MRALICFLVGHDPSSRTNDPELVGAEADCHRCGHHVRWLMSFGWVRAK